VHSLDRLARNLVDLVNAGRILTPWGELGRHQGVSFHPASTDLRRIVSDLTGRGVRAEFMKEQLTFTGEDNAMAQ